MLRIKGQLANPRLPGKWLLNRWVIFADWAAVWYWRYIMRQSKAGYNLFSNNNNNNSNNNMSTSGS